MNTIQISYKQAKKLTKASPKVNAVTMWHNIRTAADIGLNSTSLAFRSKNQKLNAATILENCGYVVVVSSTTNNVFVAWP